jgi:MinD-like ATPase involved in chromosome partitioning or flagellar assembly
VLIACWSPKGGSGTTVVSVALSLVLAAGEPSGALLADLDGDAPAALGIPDPSGLGLADWLAADNDVPGDALEHLELEAAPGLRIVPAGAPSAGAPAFDRAGALAAAFASDPRPVVADCGRANSGAPLTVASGAGVSLLVLRPCYLAIRRALAAPIRPSGVVLVTERDRALGPRDVEQVLGAPVLTVLGVEPSVARAIDAGLLARRMPRPLAATANAIAASLPFPPGRPQPESRHLHLQRRAHQR